MTKDVRADLRAFYDQEMTERASRPVTAARSRHLDRFVEEVQRRGAVSVLEVGCGAGRDGTVIQSAGLAYTGVDLSASSIDICVRQGLRATRADAISLPFGDSTFDAAWSMSTLMHLPDNDFGLALRELARVVRPGGLVEIGVWGHIQSRDWASPDGRFFRQRSDRALRAELSEVCTVLDFATWDWQEDDAHYQWARTEVTTP
ncbi:hypothetical protein ASG73_00385 [Janibacter sp. Soil728]|uniref:class I SAM-dependent methyltransferase n=1 Tax=Janibacter sp. Soil728 TaxID=1736393 RepID=UPI0006F3C581|nr:class I SAM-dependent methyltransferase [Janibacter sp. Soil728]KRE38867.1 hypothetical protein ASG73_00385 [Janibacter sp. Soil728]